MEYSIVSLIIQTQQGNEKSLVSLLERYEPLINNTAGRYCRAKADCSYEDAQSEMKLQFIRIVKAMRLDGMRSTENEVMSRYLKSALLNSMNSLLEKEKKTVALQTLADLPDAQVAKYEESNSVTDEYEQVVLSELQSCLTEREYEVIWRLFFLRSSAAEIASHLACTRQTVNNIKLSAFEKIRKKYEEAPS